VLYGETNQNGGFGMQELKVEIVLRKRSIDKVPERISKVIDQYRVFDGDNKTILNMPLDWAGLRDGTLPEMFNLFGDAIYVSLAYYTSDGRELVTDFEGNPADRYDSVLDGRRVFKYVKKKLRIVTVYDEGKEIFEVKGFMLDFDNKVVKVCDIYNNGAESGLALRLFVNR